MILTTEQLNILNHVVEDGQAWADNTTEVNMLAKVAKYKQSYLDAQGEGYKTRKQRDDANTEKANNDYDNAPWNVKRMREYPRIHELIVACYDTDDKAAIEKRRADVKAKYPKP